jgi:hypothetical protein
VLDKRGRCCAPTELDCAGVCSASGGSAVIDDCGHCVLGSTGYQLNYAKDCAGQCFGNRSATDPYVLAATHTHTHTPCAQDVLSPGGVQSVYVPRGERA